MNRHFYLLTLDIYGIKNIANPIHLDFYKKTIKRDFNPEKYKIKAIYGENGSGKTAIITAVKLLSGQNAHSLRGYRSVHRSRTQRILVTSRTRKQGPARKTC